MAYRGKSTPRAWERICIDRSINRRYSRGRGMWVREVVYSSILAWFSGLGNPRERRRLKGANEGLHFSSRAWADVLELIRDHFLIGLRVQEEGGAIRGSKRNVDRPYAGVETIV